MIPYKIVTDIEQIDFLQESLAFDSETDGLYGKIMLIQLYQASWDEVILIQQPTSLQIAQLINFLNSVPDIVMHNSSYDLSCIQDHVIDWIPENIQDTLHLSRLAYPKMDKFSLDMCYNALLHKNPYRENNLIKKEQQSADWSGTLEKDQIQYACIDVFYLLDLYDTVKHKVDSTAYKLDIQCVKDCLSWQSNGVPLSENEICLAIEENEEAIAKIDLPDTLNVNSWQQVRAHINSSASDKLFLSTEAVRGSIVCKDIIDKRSHLKQISFLKMYEKHLPRVSGHFGPLARSGRLTCKYENLQQWPVKLKRIVKAPENKILVYTDFDSLEMRCIAAVTGDASLTEIVTNGLSPHDFVAERVFGPDYTKKQRTIAKTMNFLLLYGGGIQRLVDMLIVNANLEISFSEASEYKKSWLEVFSEIAEWQQKGFSDHRNKISWKTPLGREYVGKLGTDQLNIQIQGYGAEVAKLARLYASQEFVKQGLTNPEDIMMLNFKHDDYLYELRDSSKVYKPASKIIGDSMIKSWNILLKHNLIKNKDIPMPVVVDCGYSLDTIEDRGSIYRYEC